MGRKTLTEQLKPDQTPAGWDEAAAYYENTVERISSRFAELMVGMLDITPGAKLLDVAAGAGVVAVRAAREGADVLATDFSPKMVERLGQRLAEDRVPQVKTAVMDGQALDLPDACMDFVTSNFGVIFFPDADQGFREMHRVLKPEGVAAITSWGPREHIGLQQVMGEAVQRVLPDLQRGASPSLESLEDPKKFGQRLLYAGFKTVEVTTQTEPWVLASARSIEQLALTNPGAKTFLASLTEQQRRDLIEALVAVLEERANGGEVSMDMQAHIAIARKNETPPAPERQ